MSKKKSESGYTRVRSLTEACVLRSKNIVIAKAAQISNRQTQLLCGRIPPWLPSSEALKEIDRELDVRMDGYRRDIGKYLKEIVTLSKHFDELMKRKDIKALVKDIEAKYHFSTNDLRQGYVSFIRENTDKELIDYVLVLNDKTELEVGQFYTFNECKNHLTSLKDNTIKTCAIYVHSAKKVEENEKQ
jgi:hypothetical protein